MVPSLDGAGRSHHRACGGRSSARLSAAIGFTYAALQLTATGFALSAAAWMLVEYPWGYGLFVLALGMQALKRLAQPDDIGGVIAFLA
jgi:hypothetical protein